jgi:DNA-binding CsgD family transcriptional regulator
VVTIRHLELAEELFEIEPSATYASRAAAIVAQLAGAASHRVVIDGTETVTGEGRGESFAVPLRFGKHDLGMLHLYFQNGTNGEDAQRIARWGGRMLARGLAYSKRIGTPGGRGEVDIQALLASTPLTPRERDVVGRLVSGHSTREIATSTGLTVATVNTYLKRIFAKLGVHSRVELLARVTGTRNAVPATSGPVAARPS